MSKKKKHYKQSISGKLRNDAEKHFKKLLKKNNLKCIRFHDLRHSCAALLLSEGRELYDVSEWLGHSDVNITAKFYGHLDMNRKKALGNTLGNSIGFKTDV